MMLQEAAGADGSYKLHIRVDSEPDQAGHPDIFSQLLEIVSEKVAVGDHDEAGLGGSFASPVEVAIGKSFGTSEGKRRNRGKKTQVRATRDGGAGGHKRSFEDKETASDGSIRTYWLQMEEYFRQVAPQDVRLLRPLTNLILTPEGDVSDPCLAIPPLGGHYLENWAKEDGAEVDRAAEALVQQSVTRVKRKILAASPVSKKRKISVSADAKVITTVISPPENDDEELCHVCNGGDSDQWNQILFCDSCDVAVHQDCYGIREVPEGEWLCTWCSHRSKHFRRALPLLRKPSEGLHADLASVQSAPPDCVLCPVRGGALKPVAEGESNGSIRASAKLRFAHLFCCQWVPETYIHSMEAMEPIKNVEGVREERWKLLCAVCKEKHGACIQCSHGMCATAFHPLCAREAKLRMEVSSREDSEDVDLRAYCQRHSSTRGGKSVAIGTELHEYAEVFVENQGLGDAQNLLAGNVAGHSADGNSNVPDVHDNTTQKIEGNSLPPYHDEAGAPMVGKSITKLLQGKDPMLISHPALETAGVQQEVSNHDLSTYLVADGQVSESGGPHSSKNSDMNDTRTIWKGKNGLQRSSSSHSDPCKVAVPEHCVTRNDIIVLDSPDRDGACVENTHAIEVSGDGLSDHCANKSWDAATGAEQNLSLDEERRQRGLRGDASTSQAGSSPAAQNATTSDLLRTSEKEKSGSLCESQGANRHLAGIVEEGRLISSRTGEPQGLLDADKVKLSNQRTGSKLEDMSTDGKDNNELKENSVHVGTNADSCLSVSALKSLVSKDSAPSATGMCGDSSGKDEASPDMQHPKYDKEFAVFIPEAEMDVHPGASKTETGLNAKSIKADRDHMEAGICCIEGVTTGTSQNIVMGTEAEKVFRSQPRLRIKIGGDSTSYSMHSVHKPGFSAVFEEGKAVDVPIQNLHQISKAALNSQWRGEVRSHPHPFVLKKLENLRRIHNNENKVMPNACVVSTHDLLKLDSASMIKGLEADQPVLPLHNDPNFVSVPKKNGLQSIMSPECFVSGDESKPGNGLVLAAGKSSEGGLDSLDAQWEQLSEAKRLGLFELAPEDEIVGEILILQDKLIDCTQANSINCAILIRKLLSLLPEERQFDQKNVQDLVIVRQFQLMAKEAKKQGRKEKRDKEAQAVLAAATAAAAASPRVSYMRRDNLGREDFMSQSPDASLESGGSQSFTPPSFAGSASAVLRTLKPPVPKPPKLVLSAGRPAGSSRAGLHVKGTTSKISVAKATSAKTAFYRENSGYYLEEAPLCSVCGGGESLRPNKIVCCDRCKVAVHQDCYGVGRIPLGAWFCQPCAEMQRLYQNLKPPEVDSTGKLGPGVQCAICPGRVGAFKRASDGRWAHVFCAQWLPETAAGKDQTATIEGLETVLLDRFALLCSICRRQQGACLTCNFGHCHGAFHPSCARDYGLYMNIKSSSGGRVQYRAYCERHSPQQRAKAELKQRGGSDEMQVLRQLRVEFERVRLICERIVRREKIKRELLHNMKDIGISQLRVATVSHNPQAHFDHNVDGYPMIQGPGTGGRGSDDIFWTDGSLPIQRVTSNNRPALGGTLQIQSDERKKHKRQRRQAEPLHSEKLMTPVEASMQNMRLPKGYAYVPVDTVPVPHQNSTDKQHPPA